MHKEHKISSTDNCIHLMICFGRNLTSHMTNDSTSSTYGIDMSRWPTCMYGRQGCKERRRKELQYMQKVRGLSAKVHHPATVQVQYAKRTSPSSSVGNSIPNPYMICHIWVKDADMQKARG